MGLPRSGCSWVQKASLPSNLFIDFGVWGPLMDEQPHYLGISFPGCQVQRVTAFRISHVGQCVVPQKNLDHIPRRQKSIMSLQNPQVFCTNSSAHLFGTKLFHRDYLIWLPISTWAHRPALPFIPWATCTAVDSSLWAILRHTTLTHHLPVYLGFLHNPSIFHYFENVWSPCLNLAMFPCLWCWNSIQG